MRPQPHPCQQHADCDKQHAAEFDGHAAAQQFGFGDQGCLDRANGGSEPGFEQREVRFRCKVGACRGIGDRGRRAARDRRQPGVPRSRTNFNVSNGTAFMLATLRHRSGGSPTPMP